MFCGECFADNELGAERCVSCGAALLPPLPDGSARAGDAPGSGAAPPASDSAPVAKPSPPPPVEAAAEPAGGTGNDQTGSRSRPTFGGPPASSAPGEAPPRAPDAQGGAASNGSDRRSHPRLEFPLNILLQQATGGGGSRREQTVADNISLGGMRVLTTWTDLKEGDEVHLSEVGGDFEARAAVRGSFRGDDQIPRLNLEFQDRQAPARLVGTQADAAAKPRPDARAAEAPTPKPERPRTSAFVAAASAPAKLGGSTAEEVAARQALRDEVLSTFQSLQSISPYDLLDIPRDADAGAIRAAYSRRASRFHPDRATGDLTGLRDAFQAILVKLGEARETLEDPGRRSYYDAHAPPPAKPTTKPTAKPKPAGAEPRTSPPAEDPTPGAEAAAPPAPNSEADALQAEQVIGQARKLFQDEKYWDCLQLLDTAMPQTQSSKLKVTMRVLWARATAKNPRWLRRAEEALLEIIQREPRHVEAHYELGRIYAASGLTTRAQRMYRRVLELEASHQGAATALNSLLTTRKL